ncbi:MAG: 3-phosphoshikimate 1-carboxyvinyltransferase [Deinococcota bacterium]
MPATHFPDTLTITPRGPLAARVTIPGSKSLTNRALIVAALAEGVSTLYGCLIAEDSEVMVRALNQLGILVEVDGSTFTVHGAGGTIPADSADLDVRLSGTSIRFLAALVSLGQGAYRLDGTQRMRERPIGDLLTSLNQLGANTRNEADNDCPPVVIEARGLQGGTTQIAGDKSSQFLSALLMSAPYAEREVALEVTGVLQSKPFVDLTLGLMADFGVQVQQDGYSRFVIPSGRYQARNYAIEGDATAAGYFWGAAAVAGGEVTVENVGHAARQGDKRLMYVLRDMGCTLTTTATSSTLRAPDGGVLKGGTFDLNDIPDQAQTLAVVALFADSPVHITNVWNMRIKETDRLRAVRNELVKFGAQVEEGDDDILIYPLKTLPKGEVHIDTYGDHRMAMAFALAGLRIPGVVIHDPQCVTKTFPDFFERLANLQGA